MIRLLSALIGLAFLNACASFSPQTKEAMRVPSSRSLDLPGSFQCILGSTFYSHGNGSASIEKISDETMIKMKAASDAYAQRGIISSGKGAMKSGMKVEIALYRGDNGHAFSKMKFRKEGVSNKSAPDQLSGEAPNYKMHSSLFNADLEYSEPALRDLEQDDHLDCSAVE
jgi:hypothetical protein